MFTQPDLNRLTVQLTHARKDPQEILYTRLESPYGGIYVFTCTEGICYLGFEMVTDAAQAVAEVQKLWPRVALREDPAAAAPLSPADAICPVFVKGTPFQFRVWNGLLTLRSGETCSYSELAERIGLPAATRAVASAVAANPVSLLIPCHRVICKGGDTGNYHWGKERKKMILRSESAPVPRTGMLDF